MWFSFLHLHGINPAPFPYVHLILCKTEIDKGYWKNAGDSMELRIINSMNMFLLTSIAVMVVRLLDTIVNSWERSMLSFIE